MLAARDAVVRDVASAARVKLGYRVNVLNRKGAARIAAKAATEVANFYNEKSV